MESYNKNLTEQALSLTDIEVMNLFRSVVHISVDFSDRI